MNVEQMILQVDRWKARTKYLEYRDAVKERARTDPLGAGKSEEAQLRNAYAAIARGEAVIDINQAIAGGGLNEQALPKLAIARADWAFVYAWWYENRCVFAGWPRRWSTRGDKQTATHNVAVRFPATPNAVAQRDAGGKAQVPMIPPALRPKAALSGYRILFEAVWVRQPPVDPLLVRHVGGPFYVVLAQWDLSPLEQSVLRARV